MRAAPRRRPACTHSRTPWGASATSTKLFVVKIFVRLRGDDDGYTVDVAPEKVEAMLRDLLSSEQPHVIRSEWIPVRWTLARQAWVRRDEIVEVRAVESGGDEDPQIQ